jgi:hypothetical protein
MSKASRVASLLMAGALFSSGCYGPFYTVRKVWEFNGQIGGKWANEVGFLVMSFCQVYSIAGLADSIIFNSLEFWTGDNPMAPTAKDGTSIQTKQIARGDSEARLTKISGPEGEQLVIEQFKNGEPAGTLRVFQRDGMTVGVDAQGQTLFTAKTQEDGGVVINDARGLQVSSYSPDDVAKLQKVAVR